VIEYVTNRYATADRIRVIVGVTLVGLLIKHLTELPIKAFA